jgi:hypothetical protein
MTPTTVASAASPAGPLPPARAARGAATEAILAILRGQPDRAYTIAELTAALTADGQPAPVAAAVRLTLYSLIRDGAAQETLSSYPRRFTAAPADPATAPRAPRRPRHTFPPDHGLAPGTVIDRVYQHLVHHADRRPLTLAEIRRRVGGDMRGIHSALTRLCAEGNARADGRPRRYTATP